MESRLGSTHDRDAIDNASIERESLDAEGRLDEGLGPMGGETLAVEHLTDEERLLIIFAYLGPLAFVSLVASPREFVRWHARQGILFGSFVLATFVVLRLPHALLFKIWPFLGQIFMTVEIMIGVGFFLVAALCLIRALEGRRFRIPFLGSLIDKL